MAAFLSESYAREKERFLQGCTRCGNCVEVCPTIPYSPLAGLSAPEVIDSLLDVLKGGRVSEEAIAKTGSCTQCSACRDVCPEGINPQIVQKALQVELIRLGQKRHPTMEVKIGDATYFLPDIVASLQIRPEEKTWLSRIPERPQQTDVVVFTGCALVMMPDKMALIADIFQRLGLDFVMLAGGEHCCGQRYSGVSAEEADGSRAALVMGLCTFQPKQVVFACAACAYHVAQQYQGGASPPFRSEELFRFLSDRVEMLDFSHPVNKTVTLHDPCAMARLLGDTSSLRKLLRAVRGLKLVEMDSNGENTICCGSGANRQFPKAGRAMVRRCLDEAARTGAEILVNGCQGCHLQFCPEESGYPLEVQNCLSLIGEAMGIGREDKIRKFYRYGRADLILAEAKEMVEAGPYDPALATNLAKRMFERRPA